MTAADLPLLPEVEIPPGDPEALREAARTYEGAGEQARRVGMSVRRTVHTTVGSQWSGAASAAFSGEGEQIAGGHDRATGVLQEGTGAITRYAHQLDQSQRLAWHARRAAEDYNREVTQLRSQEQAAAADPGAQAHMQARADQLAAERHQISAQAADAHTTARNAANSAAGAFGAVAQGALSIVFPGTAATALAPKAVIDSLMGLRKEIRAFRGLSAVAGSTEDALARWLGFGGRLGRFGRAVAWVGKRAPAVGIPFGVYDMVAPGSSAGERVMGATTATASGVLTVSAFSSGSAALAAAGLSWAPPAAAAVLVGVAAYQLYKHREAIGKGLSKAWSATSSGVTKAAKWTGDKLGDAKNWAADRASDAASAVKKGVGNAAEGFAHGVSKAGGAIANAFGF